MDEVLEMIPPELLLLGMAALGVGVPLLLVIFVVQKMKENRKADIAQPWGAMAEKWGGQFNGNRIVCQQEDRQLMVQMVLISVIQARATPGYHDGGTFTKGRIAYSPKSEIRIFDGPEPRVVQASQLVHRVPAVELLPPAAEIVLNTREAAVIWPGAVTDTDCLSLTAKVLTAIADSARDDGPFQVQ